jgi:hypothetical protein
LDMSENHAQWRDLCASPRTFFKKVARMFFAKKIRTRLARSRGVIRGNAEDPYLGSEIAIYCRTRMCHRRGEWRSGRSRNKHPRRPGFNPGGDLEKFHQFLTGGRPQKASSHPRPSRGGVPKPHTPSAPMAC